MLGFSAEIEYLCTRIMAKRLYTYIIIVAAIVLSITGCTDGKQGMVQSRLPHDTLYTEQKAIAVYGYDPVRALQIVDSAVIVGNMSSWRADKNRARIYSLTRAGERLDSLMHWSPDARFDTARIIGEQLIRHDSIKNSLERQQDVLEILAYVARCQKDTTLWLRRSRQLVEVCRRQGAETEALRGEAEIGAALCYMGQESEGMAMMDRAIGALSDGELKFNELDALVIALKRKAGVMISKGQAAEVLPLARRIVTLLNDYEHHPDKYHDGTYREPPASRREEYIRFYRSQGENFIATAYAALGQSDDMYVTFERLENIVRDAETREHRARYDALEQQLKRQESEAHSRQMTIVAIATVCLLLFALLFAAYVFAKNRIINMKNRGLVKLIDEAMRYKERYEQMHQSMLAHVESEGETVPHPVDLKSFSADALFQYLYDDIREKRLYLDPKFDRQAVCSRYGLTAVQVGNAFAQGSDYDSVADFVRDCRLEYACHLLTTTDMKVADAASASGFSRATTFNHDFKARYNLTPSEYRRR